MRDVTMNNEQTFQTSDFPLAAYLYSKGIILQKVINSVGDNRRKLFIFDYPPEQLLSDFQSGSAEINVMAFTHAQNHLRNLIK